MRGDIQVIQRLLQSGSTRTRLNKTWQRLHEDEGIGRIIGNEIAFEPREMERLQRKVKRDTGLDPLVADLSGERMDIAETSSDEKLSSKRVFENLITVASRGAIPLITGDAMTPPGSMLYVSIDAVDLSRLDSVVVIENGSVIRHWDRISLPSECAAPLFVYRGHGRDASIVKAFTQNAVAAGVMTCAFFDFDPAGLQMATQAGVSCAIVPLNWRSMTKNDPFVSKFNKREEFAKQLPVLSAITSSAESPLTPVARFVGENGIAITQEHLVVHAKPLTLIKMSPVPGL